MDPDLRTPPGVEWPTAALALVIYGLWAALTLFHEALHPLALALLGGWVTAWHGSLQHETIHGHPTPWRRVNAAIGWVPLSLWLPYETYQRSHLDHHASAHLTHPDMDAESRYLPADASPSRRLAARLQARLAGRLLLGPAFEIAQFLGAELGRLARGERKAWGVWLRHALGVAAVVAWLHGVCGMSLWAYLAGFVYPGLALSLIRSFAEHRAAAEAGHRVAVVERAPVLGLLFLNNNLHAVHHAEPGLAWWRLPRIYRARRAEIAAANGGLVYRGYADVFRRFLWRPHDGLIHPAFRTAP